MLVVFVKCASNLVGLSLIKSYAKKRWNLFNSAYLFHFLNTRLSLPNNFFQIHIVIDLTCRPKLVHTSFSNQ